MAPRQPDYDAPQPRGLKDAVLMCRNRLDGGVSLKGYGMTVVALFFSFCVKILFATPNHSIES